MIALLRGRVAATHEDQVVLDCGGVGYQVFCHLRALAALHDQRSDEVTLYIHTSVSADAIRLFGFLAADELRLFRLLIGVERIGPKAALGILGRAELATMVGAIRDGDAALVATVPGVGRKTAERVILELRDRVDLLTITAATAPQRAEDLALNQAVSGLVGLGFREADARVAVTATAAELSAVEVTGLVSGALRRLDQLAPAP
ncbi:MAG: Holliday junction branch migration protein RuvA [Candidatus Dormibacteria bacterium]